MLSNKTSINIGKTIKANIVLYIAIVKIVYNYNDKIILIANIIIKL